MTVQNIDLNLIPGKLPQIVHASQFDEQANAVKFTLYQGDTLFTLPSNAGVTVEGKKPDSTGFQYQASTATGNTVTINLTKQMTAVDGDTICELRITAGEQSIGSANFVLRVEKSPMDDSVISETVLPLIEEAAEIASTISEYVESVAQSAMSATAAAATATTAAAQAQTAAANVEQQYDALTALKAQAAAAAEAAQDAADAIDNMSAAATTLPTGSSATASYDSNTGVITFGIPTGATGASGISAQTSGWFAMGVEPTGAHAGELFVEYVSGELSADNFDLEADGDLYYVIDEE